MQRSAGKKKSEGGPSDEAPERNGEEEEDEIEAEAEAVEDQFEAALAARGGGGGDTWQAGGARKDVVIRILVQCFASMVESLPREDAIPDYKGRYRSEDLVHVKLLDANKQVVKAKKTLLKHENFATRDFTIFIAQKHWVPNILRPLLELCAKDDTNLAMNCAGLALVLVRRMSDKTLQLLQESKGKKQKRKRITEKPENKEGKNPSASSSSSAAAAAAAAENEEEQKKSAVLSDSEEEENDEEDEYVSQAVVDNARQQLSVLLSFKEGLCSDKCNEAITNAFREFWSAEQSSSNEDTKLGVAICLSYFRRILAIGPDPLWSSPGEILKQRDVHHQYIVQLRALLSVIPGICSDLRRSYHDDWLVDVIHIIYHILQSYDAEDMFLVWKEKGIIDQFSSLYRPSEEEEEEEVTESSASTASAALPIAVPAALKDKYSQKTLSKGLLSSKLQAERSARSQVISKQAVQNRFNRSSATYKQNIYIPQQTELFNRSTSINTSSNSGAVVGNEDLHDANAAYERNQQIRATGGEEGDKARDESEAGPADSVFLRTVFGQPSDSIPQAKARRNRRNITFVKGNPYLGSKAAPGQTLFAQQATVIAASFLEVFSQEACFKTFVRRVNEDLRRDERRISQDVEMEYFHILFKVLQYNRLKLQHGQQVSSQWQPSFKNIIDTLDKMSFTRVVVTLEKLFLQSLKQSKSHLLHSMKRFITQSQVIFPLQLYAEMIAYLRLMLCSDNLTYYEIAIGALYRLYYVTNSSKLDVLVRLFNNYKNNVYTKDYLDALIICAHETFQVLETARTVFVEQRRDSVIYQKYHHILENFLHKKSMKGLSKKDLDMEVYILSCYKFDVYDYFKKIMTPHTVDLYMKVLVNVEENSSSINDYILHFMQRCYDFKIEKDGFYADSTNLNSPSANISSPLNVNLSYLFFNLSSLSIIHSLLTNINVQTNAKYGELLLFLRRVVRDFALLAQKNHLLLVEALLNNITNMDVCHNIFTVYDARLIIGGPEGHADTSLRHASSEMAFNKANSSDDELGDEFDEEDLPKAFTDHPEQEKKRNKGASKASTLRRNRKKKSAIEESDGDVSINDSSSSDSAGDSDKEDKSGKKGLEDEKDQSDADGLSKDSDNDEQLAKRAKRTSASDKTKKKWHRWSAEEDATLERLYALYASSRSLHASIAEHEDMEAFGTNRTSQQVAARIRLLGLREKSKSGSEPTKAAEPSHLDAVVEKAAWEVDEEEGIAIFEERSRALERLSQRMTASEEEAEEESAFPQDYSSRSKESKSSASKRTSKTSRTKAKALKKLSKSSNRASLSENEESAGEMNLVEEDSKGETPLPQMSATLSASGTSSLAKMLESDDEDL